MKICIVTHTFPRFQGDTPAPFMENLAKALTDLGHNVFVLAPFDPKFDLNTKRKYKIVIYRYAPFDNWHTLGYSREFDFSKNLRFVSYLLAPLLLFFGLFSLVKLIKKERIDIVSAHWLIPSGFMAALATLITRTPFTVTIPGSDVYLGRKNLLFRAVIALTAKKASYVLADNIHYLNQLIDLGIIPPKRKVIVYGSDVERFKLDQKDKEILRKLGLKNETRIVLAVGRLVPKKGFIYLVQAMPTVFKKFPDVRLLIVGDGIEREKLEKESKRLRISEMVTFAGTINYDELSKYYNLGNVFVMPSVRDEQGNIDASPVAMMEAMACGMPVVATKFSGSENFVVEGQTGFLVPEKSSRTIASALINLLSVDRNTMRNNVRKVAIEKFSTRVVAQKYTEIFRELIQ